MGGGVNHCKDCKHWAPYGGDDRGQCKLAATTDNYNNIAQRRPLASAYGGGVEARLVTLPEFGCVQWEAQ